MEAQWKAGLAIVCALACVAAQAQSNTLAGTVNSRLVLEPGCSIDAGSGSVSNADFGTLDFGTQPSGFTGSLQAHATGSAGTTQVTCSPDVMAVEVTIDNGQFAGMGMAVGAGTRALEYNGSYVPYEVYSDASHATQYVANTMQSVTVPSPGNPFDLPIYGVANKTNPTALQAGTYTDVLNVTLGW